MTLSSSAFGEWQPPENPSPREIHREAEADARAGRYEDALAKHLWYHENAEKLDPGQTGVRRSFALSNWYDLAADYPPALAKFKEVRDAARKDVLESEHRKHVWNAFADYKAMSKQLGKEDDVTALFLELHDKNKKHAEKVYRLAQDGLVDAGRFDLCGEYLDADRAMEIEIKGFEVNNEFASRHRGAREFYERTFGERHFRHSAAMIVAIVANNDKLDEAKRLAQQARDAWDDEQLNEALDAALAGTPPAATR